MQIGIDVGATKIEYILLHENGEETNKTETTIQTSEENETLFQNEYNSVMKHSKKDNITVHNIGEIMLSQIPSVSITIANAVMNKYKTLSNLIVSMNANPDCLQDVVYTTKTGKQRHISITSIKNIFDFLTYNEKKTLDLNNV